jgi:putative peptidoglycan lipid II flippase
MPSLGQPGIMAIAIGVLLGGVGIVLIQWLPLRREGFRYAAVFDPRDRALRDVVMLMGPGTIGMAATQVNILVSTLLATSQGTGAVSWLTYAFRIMALPIGLFGVSIATASLPAVARQAAVGDVAGIRTTVSRALAMTCVLNVPATLGLLALAEPIVALLFEHGRFMSSDTRATADALRLYAVGLMGYSAARIATPTFYALRQSRTAVIVSLAAILANIVLAFSLVAWMGFRGLALATALAALGNGALSLLLLGRRLQGIGGRHLTVLFIKVLAAAIAMAAAAWTVHQGMTWLLPTPQVLMQAVRLGVAIGTGLAVLAATARLLRVAEFEDVLGVVAAPFTRRM